MNRTLLILTTALSLSGFALAQHKTVKAAPVAPVVTDEAFYPLPLAERDKIRDAQHENDQLEIENQKMLLKIEQNRTRQAFLIDQIKLIAFQFAQAKHVDLDQYELDPGEIRFARKKGK